MAAPQPTKRSCSWPCCCRAFLIIFVIIGIILTIAGVIGTLRYHAFFKKMLATNMPLNPASPNLKKFKNPPIEIYRAFRIFNVTNADDVVGNGSKPVLKEIGPYVFRTRRERYNVQFNDEFTEMTYDERRFFEFDEERSIGSLADTFVNIDIVGYKIVKTAYDKGQLRYIAKTLSVTKRQTPFKKHVVGEFLLGAEDKLLKRVLPMKFKDPKTRPPSVFGILVDRATGKSANGSLYANFTLNTGKQDIGLYQSLVQYNGMTRLPNMYPILNDTVHPITGGPVDPNEIQGTSVGGFPPDLDEDSIIAGFGPELCLVNYFVFNSSSKTGPVDTMRFMFNPTQWRAMVGDLNRAQCDAADRADPEKCLQNGVINSTRCKGVPLVNSLPHFLHADEYYKSLVEGLTPDPEKHSLYLDIDPLTGSPLNFAKGMQINMPIVPIKYKYYKNLPQYTLMPILWAQETGGISKQALGFLHNMVHARYNMIRTAAFAILVVGIALLPVTVLIYVIFQYNYKRRTEEWPELVVEPVVPNASPYMISKREGHGIPEEKRALADG